MQTNIPMKCTVMRAPVVPNDISKELYQVLNDVDRTMIRALAWNIQLIDLGMNPIDPEVLRMTSIAKSMYLNMAQSQHSEGNLMRQLVLVQGTMIIEIGMDIGIQAMGEMSASIGGLVKQAISQVIGRFFRSPPSMGKSNMTGESIPSGDHMEGQGEMRTPPNQCRRRDDPTSQGLGLCPNSMYYFQCHSMQR